MRSDSTSSTFKRRRLESDSLETEFAAVWWDRTHSVWYLNCIAWTILTLRIGYPVGCYLPAVYSLAVFRTVLQYYNCASPEWRHGSTALFAAFTPFVSEMSRPVIDSFLSGMVRLFT